MLKVPVKYRFVLILWFVLGSLSGGVYLYRVFQYRQSTITSAVSEIRHHNTIAVNSLLKNLELTVKLANTLSESLSLHIRVIERNQMLFEEYRNHPERLFEPEMDKLAGDTTIMPDYHAIFSSQQADFLRKIISVSDYLIDHIIVTDAFGFVVVASSAPSLLHYFKDEWWQRSLMLEPGSVYQFHQTTKDYAGYLYFSFQLLNYEDKDPVGVILCRLNLERLLGKAQSSWPAIQANTYLVADGEYTWGPVIHQIYPAVRDLHRLTYGKTEPFVQTSPDFAAVSSTLSGKLPSIIPNLNWSVITFQPLPAVYSLKNAVFRRMLAEWIVILIILTFFSYKLGVFAIKPFLTFAKNIRLLTDENTGVEKSSHLLVPDLTDIVTSVAKKLESVENQNARQLKETLASMKAFTDYAREAALETNRKIVTGSFLDKSMNKSGADAGILYIHNPDYPEPMMLQSGCSDKTAKSFTSLSTFGSHTKTIYFSWNHPLHQDVWDNDFQMILSIPVQTRDLRFGTLYLLFRHAIDLDLERDQTLDLLAQQCAIYSSRSALYYSLERQISFTEGILSGIPWFICTINHQMYITWHNSYRTLFSSRPLEKLVGSFYHVLFPESFAQDARCPVKKTFRDGLPHHATIEMSDGEAQARWLQLNTYACKDETGQSRSVILFIRDITDEKLIRNDMHNYMMAIDNLAEAVVVTDLEGRISFINKAFTKILKYSLSDVKGHRFDLLIPGKEAGVFKTILGTASRDDTWSNELELIDRNENFMTVSLNAAVMKDSNDIPTGIAITCFDLTSRMERERGILKQIDDLETLHALIEILNHMPLKDTSFEGVLNYLISFSGCESGVFILFDAPDYRSYTGSIKVDHSRPAIIDVVNVPGYFVKFIDECRQGRQSVMLERICSSEHPLVWNNLSAEKIMESKLVLRMGFESMLGIPVHVHSECFGCLLLFSKTSRFFDDPDTMIYSAMASQIAWSLHGKYLHRHLETEARFTLTGEIISSIGGDIRQVLQSLESSQHIVDTAMETKDLSTALGAWTGMSWHIWKLYQLSLNIALYDSENEQIFFPENINSLVTLWLDQISRYAFSNKITVSLDTQHDVFDAYINKPEIQRAFLNVLTLAIDACWFETSPEVSIRTATRSSDYYSIDIQHNGKMMPSLLQASQTGFSNMSDPDLPLLLKVALQSIAHHKGSLTTLQTGPDNIFRITLPRYPIKVSL